MNIATLFVFALTIAVASAYCTGSWGEFGPCGGGNANCGDVSFRARYYFASGTGCPHAHMEEERDPNPCTVLCSGNSCEGHWAPGPCVSNGQCDSNAGTITETYTVTKPQGPGGNPCEANPGQTRHVPCTASEITPCAVNCEGSWSDGVCNSNGQCGSSAGTRTQTYHIHRHAQGAGAACETHDGDTRNGVACYDAHVTPCVGCEGSWTHGQCNSNGQCGSSAGTRVDTYRITRHAEAGGAACEREDGATRDAQCYDAPVTPCIGCLGSWGNPTECVSDGVCDSDAGKQTETYTITREAGPGGEACEAHNGQTRQRHCHAHVTPCVGCEGGWVGGNECTSNGICGSDAGTTLETYRITQQAGPGGRACPHTDGETRHVGCSAAVRPCQGCVGEFGEYSQCQASALCGTTHGRRRRTFTITTQAEQGGVPCNYHNGQSVEEDCDVPLEPCVGCEGSFGAYGACVSNGQCGSAAGKTSRTYTITRHAGPGGAGCPYGDGQVVEEHCDTAEVRPCQGCVGSFTESECTALKCGAAAGTKKRTYTITTPAEEGGYQCPHANGYTDTLQCEATITPCVDCIGSWSEYTACQSDGICNSAAGKQTRTYTVTQARGSGFLRGKSCPAKDKAVETKVCDAAITPCPPEDCVGNFGPVSACKVTECGTEVGTQTRTFTVTKNAAYGGKACEHQNGFVETTPCQGVVTPCPVDCKGAFVQGQCEATAACGTIIGKRVNTYVVNEAAAHGGAVCPHQNGDKVTVDCTVPLVECPPEDCQGSFGYVSKCVVEGCGTTAGRRSKKFTVTRQAAYGGKACEANNGEEITEDCVGELTPCPVDCKGKWTEFSECKSNGVCGSAAGTRSRKFVVESAEEHGGAKCSVENDKVETEACEAAITPCPPEPCEGEWTPATQCVAKGCGSSSGTQSRTYRVKKAERYGGAVCDFVNGAVEHLECEAPNVPCPVNCEGSYNEWTECASYKCGTDKGSRKRTWTQTVAAAHGGTECQVADKFVETQICDLPAVVPCPPVDCVGEYSADSECKAETCGTHDGTSFRTFKVSTPASWGGKECAHKDGEVITSKCDKAVNFAECPVDCVGKWGYWSNCVGDQPCGCKNGHKTRTYKVSIAAAHGGKQCVNADGDQEKEPCTLALEHQKLCGSEFRDAPCVEMQTLYEKAEKLKCKLNAIIYALSALPEKK